jgi:hypothetical protein
MNILVKAAIAGALSLGATGAFAAVGAPWSNSSDVLLVVENASTHNAYALDTGISINSLLPTSSLVSGAVLNTSLSGINTSINASSALTSFLAANPASGDLWTLEAGQYNGGGVNTANNNTTKIAGDGKVIFTSQLGTANNTNASGKILSNMNSVLNGLNNDITLSNGGLFSLNSTNETTTATVSSGSGFAENRYGLWTAIDFSSLGSSAIQLFGYTGNGGTGKLQSYILGSVTLDTSGNLKITGNAPTTPLPAAVWLLGSGLVGLFGVSRRRTVAAA